MKSIQLFFIICAVLLFSSCNNTQKQASISGNINNLPSSVSTITLRTPTQIKNISIKNGVFKDTINIDGQFCQIRIGAFEKTLFLDKNTQLIINANADDYENSLSYGGKGKKVNTYLHLREQQTLNVFEKIDSINNLSYENFNSFKTKINRDIKNLLKEYANINPFVIKTEKENLDFFIQNIDQQYKAINGIDETLKKGNRSPEFTNLENYKGGTTSLKDLLGSYVYIDIWATWCPPCKAEIPYLKNLEKQFHNKNIKFVSLSIDSPNAKKAWRKMIEEKQMGGIQLFADGNTDFIEAYNITGIPRFILLDTEGKIISDNAPRPSSNQINTLLKNLP